MMLKKSSSATHCGRGEFVRPAIPVRRVMSKTKLDKGGGKP